jgi:hypothetical protein
MLYIIGAVAFLAVVGFLYAIIVSPALKYHSFWYKVKAWIVFKCGHIRRLDFFPFFTVYGYDVHEISIEKAKESALVAQPGDVGLHLDKGFLSNLAIPGAFKHAWVFVEDGKIVEAISEGVVKRDALYPLLSDHVVILRPIGVSAEETKQAVDRANALVGCEYDANFNFDLEEDDKYADNLKGAFHAAFSCTETVACAWYKCRKKLHIFRSVHAGREAVVADDYLSMNFAIVWASDNVTMDWLKSKGILEEGREKLKDYLAMNATAKALSVKQ